MNAEGEKVRQVWQGHEQSAGLRGWHKSRDLVRVRVLDLEPEQHQERHSPTEAVEVRTGRGRERKVQARRRAADSRFVDKLDREQVTEAAENLYRCWLAFTELRPLRGPNLDRVDQGRQSNTAEAIVAKVERYEAWLTEVRREGVDATVVVTVICGGASPASIDRGQHKANGWALEQVVAGLKIWRELAGRKQTA